MRAPCLNNKESERRPELARSLRYEAYDEAHAFLLGKSLRIALQGKAMLLASLLDGQRSFDELLLAAKGQFQPSDLRELLEALGRIGALRSDVTLQSESGSLSPGAATHVAGKHSNNGSPEPEKSGPLTPAGWGSFPRVASFEGPSKATPVQLVELIGGHDTRLVRTHLEGAGVSIEPEADVKVVLTDDYLRPFRLGKGERACLVQLCGEQPLVGPFLGFAGAPCLACLTFALRRQRPLEVLLERQGNGQRLPLPGALSMSALSMMTDLLNNALVTASGPHHPLADCVVQVEAGGARFQMHRISKRPQCEGCGTPDVAAMRSGRRIALRRESPVSVRDGGYRTVPAHVTYERLKRYVDPLLGPVSYLHPMPGRGFEGLPVFVSGFMVCPGNRHSAPTNLERVCAGKGMTAEQAQVSALCEALERQCSLYQGNEAVVWGDIGSVQNAVGPDQLLLFSERQYARPSQSRYAEADWVPTRWEPNISIAWTPAWSLSADAPRLLPLAHCYYEVPDSAGAAYCRGDSNGCASGNCLEEAILHGLFEVVERDAVAIWWYNRVRRPEVDVASLGHPELVAELARYPKLGWKSWVLDLTHDLSLPVTVAVAQDPDSGRIYFGFGCHVSPFLAVQRSLTELAQVFDPLDLRPRPWSRREVGESDFVRPDPTGQPTNLHCLPEQAPGKANLCDMIGYCVERLRSQGLELIVADKTRPDVELSIAQVVVPGLRHIWPRFGPGRLYDVPCALGWQDAPLDESELNPIGLTL